MIQPAFYLNASACSGCKACQAACKDKHDLPVELLWRRVYEVTGGAWTPAGETWTSDVFAYNLSLSCHHCAHPVCVEVCPTQAMHQRADGIVAVDPDACMGCQYCAWACPYEAPQYDHTHGRMTKCDFCADDLAAGKPPACVAACPMRVLEVRDRREASPQVDPLPDPSLTRPSLIVTPHRAAHRPGVLGNAEEVSAPPAAEHSLVLFTILAQLSVGALWFLSVTERLTRGTLAGITAIALIALGASFLHLGQPRNAWRAVTNLRTSWLSREVLTAACYMASLLGALVADGRGIWSANAFGLALVGSMAQVYRLRTVPEWNHRATTVSFFSTTLLLGLVLGGALSAAGSGAAAGAAGLIVLRQLIARREPRALLLLRAAALVALLTTVRSPIGWWIAGALTLTAELWARRLFYVARDPRGAWRLAAHGAASGPETAGPTI